MAAAAVKVRVVADPAIGVSDLEQVLEDFMGTFPEDQQPNMFVFLKPPVNYHWNTHVGKRRAFLMRQASMKGGSVGGMMSFASAVAEMLKFRFREPAAVTERFRGLGRFTLFEAIALKPATPAP